MAQRVPAHDLEVLDAVQEQVDAGDAAGRQVALLAEEPAPQQLDLAAGLLDVLHCAQQHARSAGGGIVDGFTWLRVEDVHHQPDHAARGVELTGLLVRGISELLDEVFIGLAEDVRIHGAVGQREAREVVDQVA